MLANAPAIYWTRFQTAQMWGQIVMKDLVGGPIAAAKLSQTTASAVAACDAADGVADGVIDDPRTCKFSATANICGTPDRAGGELPDPGRSGGHRQDLGRPAKREGQQDLVRARSRDQLGRSERHQPVRARCHPVPLGRARPHLRLADGHRGRLSAGGAGRLAEHRGRHRHLRRPRFLPAPRRQAADLRRGKRPAHHAARGDQLLPADGVPLWASTASRISSASRASIDCSALPASPIAAEAPDRSRKTCSTRW